MKYPEELAGFTVYILTLIFLGLITATVIKVLGG